MFYLEGFYFTFPNSLVNFSLESLIYSRSPINRYKDVYENLIFYRSYGYFKISQPLYVNFFHTAGSPEIGLLQDGKNRITEKNNSFSLRK